MIKIENCEVVGWESAIRGMRNPMNSWNKSDSGFKVMNQDDYGLGYKPIYEFIVGENDLKLMKQLCKAGTDHRKFMRMITVYVDITAPLYWLKEFDTYKISTVSNSCSTMHKIHTKELTLDDFSHENLIDFCDGTEGYLDTHCFTPKNILEFVIETLNHYRSLYIDTKDKKYWYQMIQLLPSSYNQKRTVMLNYEVLANMYKSRKNHKLDEWRSLCEWIKTLPYSKLITGELNE